MRDTVLGLLIFLPIIASVISFGIGTKNRNARDLFVMAVCVLETIGFLFLGLGSAFLGAGGTEDIARFSIEKFCGLGLNIELDGFRFVYCMIACVMWVMTSFLGKQYFSHYNTENRYYLFFLITFGATLGVLTSADLYTTFIFFEIMSFTSYVWVTQDEKKESLRAAETYLAIAVIGGLVMLMGLFILYHETGTLNINGLYSAVLAVQNKNLLYVAAICMLFGFGAKAGAFPLHIWLPKAHPVAPAPASALLSGILTKSGIYGVLVITTYILRYDEKWATLILILGTLTMVVGAVLALFSIDLKRTLACSSVSQIGFILIGVGMMGLLGEENANAVHGTFLHMMNHSLFKLVLFMCAGVVFMNLHELDLNKIRGFGRKKPLLNFCFLMGALGIGGIPLWNGYVSKTLLHEGIVEFTELLEEGHITSSLLSASLMKGIEWTFLVSGGITVAYMTKLYICLFVEKNRDSELQKKYDDNRKYMNGLSTFALVVPAAAFPVLGIFASVLMDGLAAITQEFMGLEEYGHHVHYLSLTNLKGGATSIAIGVILYLVVVRLLLMRNEKVSEKETVKVYKNYWPKWLDLEDYIYRPVLLVLLPAIFGFFSRIADSLVDGLVVLLRKTLYKDSPLPFEPVEGTMRTYKLGSILNRLLNNSKDSEEEKTDYIHKTAMRYNQDVRFHAMIARSMSFGLALFCIGLLATLFYMLFAR